MYIPYGKRPAHLCAKPFSSPLPNPKAVCTREASPPSISHAHIILSTIAEEDTQTEVSKYPAKTSSLYVCCITTSEYTQLLSPFPFQV